MLVLSHDDNDLHQVDRIIDAVGVENIRENVIMDKMQVIFPTFTYYDVFNEPHSGLIHDLFCMYVTFKTLDM